eukprot:301106_1
MSTVPNCLLQIDYILNICDQCLHPNDNQLPILSLQSISNKMAHFFESYTKQTKYEIIKKTVLFREKALKSCDYGCIRYGTFIKSQMILHPQWLSHIKPKLLLSTNNSQSSILDIGCCFGTDLRYCLHLGCNKNQILGVDINADFINLGFDYFGDRELLTERFIAMNVLDPIYNGQTKLLNNNNYNLFEIIQISHVYHLLNEKEGNLLMKLCVSLLKKPNGIIFGKFWGCKKEGVSYRRDKLRYLHSKQSFKCLMEKYGNFQQILIQTSLLPIFSKKFANDFGWPNGAMILTFFGRIKAE